MSERYKQNEQVPKGESLLRQIRVSDHWNNTEKRPSSALFHNPVFSSFVEALQSIEDTQKKNQSGGGVVSFSSDDAIRLDFNPILVEEEGNYAHVNVYHPTETNQTKSQAQRGRKSRARGLVDASIIRIQPTFSSGLSTDSS